jgi:integrase
MLSWRLLFVVGIQDLLRHKDVKTTMIHIHVLNQGQKRWGTHWSRF